MTDRLETAANPENLRRVAIDPVSRVEGHGKVTLLMDENDRVRQARFHVVEFRGFEKFIQGRPYWEIPVLVQRLCGICPVSHHLAAAKAVDRIAGVRQLTEPARKLRRLLHFGQLLQSHALHFFHLSSPDLLFGFESDPAARNVVGVIDKHPDLAVRGVMLRKYGQEIIRMISGKRVHGVVCIPGGMNKPLASADRDSLVSQIDEIVDWADQAVTLIKNVYASSPDYSRFAAMESPMLSLAGPSGALELYDGGLRARDQARNILFDQVDNDRYRDYIGEEVKSWSYMKFPFLKSIGREGWYRVGPLARVINCDFIATPAAEARRQELMAVPSARSSSLAYHWARMIELLHSAESIRELLHDPEICSADLLAKGNIEHEGVGIIEAPRGTLFHHYRVNEQGLVEMANLIVSTTSNNQAMNEAVKSVALEYLDGHQVTEGLLNRIEVAIRCFDPCLSCATHAVGKMPLEVQLLDSNGNLLHRLEKNVG